MGAWQKIGNVMVGMGLLVAEEMENSNPKAVLALAEQKRREASAIYLKQLGDAAGFAKSLADQVIKNVNQIDANRLRIKQLIAAVAATQAKSEALIATGDKAKIVEGNQLKLAAVGDQQKASALASATKQLVEHLDDNKAQAAASEATYQQRKREFEGWDRMTSEKINEFRDLLGETQMQEAQAVLAKQASPLNFDPNDALNSGMENLKHRKSSAEGAVRVASESIQSNPYLVSQAEQEARDAAALAEFEREFAAEATPKA
ncbi:MAG: hypothetical protein WCO84_07990 [bacterium]